MNSLCLLVQLGPAYPRIASSCKAGPRARLDAHHPGHDSAKPVGASQGSSPARLGGGEPGGATQALFCVSHLWRHREALCSVPSISRMDHRSQMQPLHGKQTLSPGSKKGKKKCFKLARRSNAQAIITQQSD